MRILLTLCAALGLCSTANADITWRVSVKFILDANGNRTSVTDDEDVINGIEVQGNMHLREAGFWYRLELVEIVDIPNQDAWFDSCAWYLLDAAAQANPDDFLFRDDCINIYVNDCPDAGWCALPASGTDTIIIGRNSAFTTYLHEIGHFMDLCHTQGCLCDSCEVCPVVLDDLVPDTLHDSSCWTARDEMADYNFGSLYDDLPAFQQEQVDATWNNIMSYRPSNIRFRLTEGQLDRMSDTSNTVRSNVATGASVFVDGNYFGLSTGASTAPWPTFWQGWQGWQGSGTSDVIVVRGDTYDEGPVTLTEERVLVASGGNAVLR